MVGDDTELDREPASDEAYRLDQFRADVEAEAFRRTHGRAFLLLRRGARTPLKRPRRAARTVISGPVEPVRELAPSEFLVYPIRKTTRSVIQRFYTVGQTRNNDVVLRDETVSKFHAFFQDDDDGEGLVLLDGRSTNGTFLNGTRVPAQGRGSPVKVSPGDRIRFGNVELSFMMAEELCGLIRAAASIANKKR